jgi:hypothetical protein
MEDASEATLQLQFNNNLQYVSWMPTMIGGESIRETVPILRPTIFDIHGTRHGPRPPCRSMPAILFLHESQTARGIRQTEMSEIALGVRHRPLLFVSELN